VATSPFAAPPEAQQNPPDPMILEGLNEVLDELTDGNPEGENTLELPSAPILDEQKVEIDLTDIEALFEE